MVNLTKYETLGESFEDSGICNYYYYYANDETFELMIPISSLCPDDDQTSSIQTKEAKLILELTMYTGLGFLLIIMIRSMKRNRLDWYRLLAFYLLGTLGFPISYAVGPAVAGFHRIVGFGVLVHNMAEATILITIWQGTYKFKSSWSVRFLILYFWVFLLAIEFLDLFYLLFLAMWQGASMDYFLVFTFFLIAKKFYGEGSKYFWIAFAAAFFHILSIQPLFMGLTLGYTTLSIFSVICLVPTFILYAWFASMDDNAPMNILIVHEKSALDALNPYKRQISNNPEIQHAIMLKTVSEKTGTELENQIKNGFDNENENKDEHGIDDYGNSSKITQLHDVNKSNTDINAIIKTETGNFQVNVRDSAKKAKNSIAHVVRYGLLYIGGGVENPQEKLKVLIIASVLTSLANTMFNMFLPCWVDTSFICDD